MNIIFISSGVILLFFTLFASLKNPGFYKSNYSEDNDDVNRNMV